MTPHPCPTLLPDDVKLTRRQRACLYNANRGCGMSYRSACNKDIEVAKQVRDMGLIYLQDRGEYKKVGRFIFRTTAKGKEVAEHCLALLAGDEHV